MDRLSDINLGSTGSLVGKLDFLSDYNQDIDEKRIGE